MDWTLGLQIVFLGIQIGLLALQLVFNHATCKRVREEQEYRIIEEKLSEPRSSENKTKFKAMNRNMLPWEVPAEKIAEEISFLDLHSLSDDSLRAHYSAMNNAYLEAMDEMHRRSLE